MDNEVAAMLWPQQSTLQVGIAALSEAALATVLVLVPVVLLSGLAHLFQP